MLNDFAVFELENIDDGVSARAGHPHVVDVLDDIVTVGENAFDVAVGVRKFLAQESDIGLGPFRPVGGGGTSASSDCGPRCGRLR